MQELSAIVPAREKQTIIKAAISKVYELFNYLFWEDFLIERYTSDNLLAPIFCLGSSVLLSNCNLISIGQYTTLELFWYVS
jgi:hypothetical protein